MTKMMATGGEMENVIWVRRYPMWSVWSVGANCSVWNIWEVVSSEVFGLEPECGSCGFISSVCHVLEGVLGKLLV